MKIEVRSRALGPSEPLRDYVLRAVHFHLSRFGRELSSISARIGDINGPKGGIDKRCQLHVRGPRLGSVVVAEVNADAYAAAEAYLRARIVGMLGGRAAEEVIYGTRTTRAEDDIEQATQLARNMVTRWGMSDRVGFVYYGDDSARKSLWIDLPGSKEYSDDTAQVIEHPKHPYVQLLIDSIPVPDPDEKWDTDVRLPTEEELRSFVDSGKPAPPT